MMDGAGAMALCGQCSQISTADKPLPIGILLVFGPVQAILNPCMFRGLPLRNDG